MSDKYVAYVSTYTQGDNYGIHIYDVDLDEGKFELKDKVKISNSSYVTITHNSKYLYSITDFGVEAYKIEPDGSLSILGNSGINGMRGCYLSTDYEDKFLFVERIGGVSGTLIRQSILEDNFDDVLDMMPQKTIDVLRDAIKNDSIIYGIRD